MQEKEYPIPEGNLYYTFREGQDGENTVCITRYQGLAGEVNIPEQIEAYPVTVIARKAFLSKKNLRKVTVPVGVKEIEDWAFAYCDGLESVVLPDQPIVFGKSLFLECTRLRRIFAGEKGEGVAALLAAAVTTAQVPYLLDISAAGSREWLEKWDARMMVILRSPDQEGYSRQVLCGEEDYGSTDQNAYESRQRKRKVRLLLLRLLYPDGLRAEYRQEMETYLREHTKGCPGEETWQVVFEEFGEDRLYYRLFAELGCVTAENIELLLSDIGEMYPEMKAYLIRYKEENIGSSDFFASLEL